MTGLRQSRKLQHLEGCLALPDGPGSARFADFTLIHNCLPEAGWQDISLATRVAGLDLEHPVIINAITGGAVDVGKINGQLAAVAKATRSVMAVGSQFSALETSAVRESYTIVRKENPAGKVFANLGAHATPDQVLQAIDMIGADAVQIHLNPGQELMMTEGDRDFTGYRANIAAIVECSPVPVIVKEVGCGIAAEAAAALADIGVRGIDVGGRGGTNFMAIEIRRGDREQSPQWLEWGIPTAISADEVVTALSGRADVIVSGGIRSPLDAVKSIAIGGSAVAMAAPLVRLLVQEGLDKTISWLEKFLEDLRRCMLLVGARSIQENQTVPLVITGYSREWLSARGIDVSRLATRR